MVKFKIIKGGKIVNTESAIEAQREITVDVVEVYIV